MFPITQNVILCLLTFSRKSCRLWEVEKYSTSRQATADSIIRRMHLHGG